LLLYRQIYCLARHIVKSKDLFFSATADILSFALIKEAP
jgi:hypothetical protein